MSIAREAINSLAEKIAKILQFYECRSYGRNINFSEK